MSKLITKARAGVTLVELLVVILIVTILSVSLLPLLKPYIEEAKYAAEPIPVIGALQTKINLFQYEKDYLPCTSVETAGCDCYSWTNSASAGLAPVYKECKITNGTRADATTFSKYPALQINWEDMKGRRMTPEHIQYAVLYGGEESKGVAQYAYAIGAFGNGNGLGKGTGFAALTIVDTQSTNKIVATWKRYKPVSQTQITFNADGMGGEDEYCHLPTLTDMGFKAATGGTGGPTGGSGSTKTQFEKLKEMLVSAGWDFVDAE